MDTKITEVTNSIYLVCSNATCVSTCQVDRVLFRNRLPLYSTITVQIFWNPGDFPTTAKSPDDYQNKLVETVRPIWKSSLHGSYNINNNNNNQGALYLAVKSIMRSPIDPIKRKQQSRPIFYLPPRQLLKKQDSSFQN